MFYLPGFSLYICIMKIFKGCNMINLNLPKMKAMSKNYVIGLFAALMLLVSSQANAQCGAPPFSSPGSITCYGTTTNVNITLGLLGGPYNIQAIMDYLNPTFPIAPYATNYVGTNY